MKISIGPVLFEWGRSGLKDFYRRMAFETPADVLYLGEVVCSKRQRLNLADLESLIGELRPSGKELVLSTLGLVMSDEEQEELHRLKDLAVGLGVKLEANDMAGIGVGEGQALVAGPHVNVYNPATLDFLQEVGVERMVFPVELPAESIQGIISAPRARPVAFELFAHGRLPLTFSARCYTARAFRLSKANCQYKCGDFPDGMITRTQEGEGLLSMNGIQTMSEKVHTLILDVARLHTLGIDLVRLSPQSRHMVEVVTLWRETLDGRLAPEEALARLEACNGGEPFCNGYFHGLPGMSFQRG
ncbi:MAG: U32 family peptidase [Magnetococcales bacterium]|nr:U32 family peptidase [Magnetococcales bacterium]